MKAINLNIHGIQCDNSACDYRDESVEYKEDYYGLINLAYLRGKPLINQKSLKT